MQTNLKPVFCGLFLLLMMAPTTAFGQSRPEFTRDYWKTKKLPDSMKGIRAEDLAVIARMNEAAQNAKIAEQGSPKDRAVQPAGGPINLANQANQSRVVQTGAATPVGPQRPRVAQPRGIGNFRPANLIPPGMRRPVAPVQQVQMQPPGMPRGNPSQKQMQQPVTLPTVPAGSAKVPALLEAARRAKASGELEQARDAYRQILKIEPYNRDVLVKAGRVEHAMGDIQNAIQAYEYLLRMEPTHAVALNDLGLCQARTGDMEASLKSLQAAVVAEPRSLRYRNNLAKVLIETNQVEAAEGVLTQLRGDALGKASVGALLAERGRNDEARDYLQKALVADPNLTAAKEKLASLAQPAAQVATLPATAESDAAPAAIQVRADEPQMAMPELSAPTIQR